MQWPVPPESRDKPCVGWKWTEAPYILPGLLCSQGLGASTQPPSTACFSWKKWGRMGGSESCLSHSRPLPGLLLGSQVPQAK